MHTNPSGQPEARTRHQRQVPKGDDNHAVLSRTAEQVGVKPTTHQTDLLIRYAELVQNANATSNITSIGSVQGVVSKLIAPSIQLLAPAGGWLPTTDWWAGRRVIDIGSGAGIPGIPLAILVPECEFTLLEARAKKCHFIRHAVEQLGISNVSVINSRAETASRQPDHRERYDVAVARAVAQLPELAELALPFVSVGGTALLPKGGSEEDLRDEVDRASKAVETLGSAPAMVMEGTYSSNGAENASARERTVYLMKIAPTPPQYPRNAGIPKKRPIS